MGESLAYKTQKVDVFTQHVNFKLQNVEKKKICRHSVVILECLHIASNTFFHLTPLVVTQH